jgi:hypothetical protein
LTDASFGARVALLHLHLRDGRMLRRISLIVVLGAAALAAVSSPQMASAEEVPDASCGPGTFENNLFGGWKAAQTFTALNSGQLTSARLELGKTSSTTGDFLFQIVTVNAGVPEATVLASTTASDASVPIGPDTTPVTAAFTSPASVVAGQLYALVVTRSSEYWLNERLASPCPGEGFVDTGGGYTANNPNIDFVYAIFVTLPSVALPQTAPTGQQAAELKKCKKKAKKKDWTKMQLKKCKKKAKKLPV